jgi:hypothetical protein
MLIHNTKVSLDYLNILNDPKSLTLNIDGLDIKTKSNRYSAYKRIQQCERCSKKATHLQMQKSLEKDLKWNFMLMADEEPFHVLRKSTQELLCASCFNDSHNNDRKSLDIENFRNVTLSDVGKVGYRKVINKARVGKLGIILRFEKNPHFKNTESVVFNYKGKESYHILKAIYVEK